VYSLFAGAKGKHGGWEQRPLIPHRRGKGEWHGYSPHAYRHAADQLATRAAWDIRPNHEALAHWSPEDFAHALLDQGFANGLAATYGDKERNRNWAARLAGLAVWELVWGDAGATMVPDIARQQSAKERVAAARTDLQLQLSRKQRVLAEMDALDTRQPADQCSGDALVRWYGERDRDHRALNRQLIRVADDIDAARIQLSSAETELELARLARVPLDELVELDTTEAAHGETPADLEPEPRHELVRGYVWSVEAAEAFDVSENTMKRWRTGRFGDRVRVPWDRPRDGGSLCPPWEQVGPRKFRLWVVDLDGSGRPVLDAGRVPPSVLERLHQRLRSDAP
jgi:hypothetical protein